MATDPTGGAPFTVGQRLLSAVMNLMRANQLIQLDTDGGTRTMTNKLTLSGTGVLEVTDKYLVTSKVLTRFIPLVGTYDSANASYSSGTGGPRFTSTSTTASAVTVPINESLESDALLTSVGFWFKAAAGGGSHHSGALGVPPKVYVFRSDPTSNTETQIGSTTTDAVATVPAYEARRKITVDLSGEPGGGHTIEKKSYTYYARFEFEGGANAVAGAYVNAIEIGTTVTSLPAGG